MDLRIATLLCFLLAIVDIEALVRRDVSSSSKTAPKIDLLESLQRNMDQFRNCIDQSLGKAVEEVNVKQVQPIFTALSDSLNRAAKAFDDLTAPTKPIEEEK